MTVSNAHIYYPAAGTTAFDLRKVVCWTVGQGQTVPPNSIIVGGSTSQVQVRFLSSGPAENVMWFDQAEFEAAMTASLNASGG